MGEATRAEEIARLEQEVNELEVMPASLAQCTVSVALLKTRHTA